MRHLLGQRPRVAVLAREGTTDQLVQALSARELDCAIGRAFDGEPTEIVQEAIYEQEPCLIVAAKSRERLSKGSLDWSRLAALDWILPPANTPMRRTFNTIFVGAGVQPPEPMVETLSLKAIGTVLRSETNAVTILGRDLVAELGASCAVLPYRLTWNLPPVTFFMARGAVEQPTSAGSARCGQGRRVNLVPTRLAVDFPKSVHRRWRTMEVSKAFGSPSGIGLVTDASASRPGGNTLLTNF